MQEEQKRTSDTKLGAEWCDAPYYHWNNSFTNEDGLSLEDCYKQYGLGKKKIFNNTCTMEVIFLDKNKCFGKSWMLKIYDRRNLNVPVKLYENDIFYGEFKY